MKKLKILATVICAAVLTGCLTQKLGKEINTEAVSKIVKGQSTRADVVTWFGQPASTTIGGDGKERLQWTYFEGKVSAQSFIPFSAPKENFRQQNLSIVLNKEKVVEDFQLTQGTPNYGAPQ